MKRETILTLLTLFAPCISLATSEVVFTNDQMTVTVCINSDKKIAQILLQSGKDAPSVIDPAHMRVALFVPDRRELRVDATISNRVLRLIAKTDAAQLIDGVVTNRLGCDWAQ